MQSILLIGYNYAPELTGIGKYSGEMGAYLANRGYEVQVITGFPYYPEWKVPAAYRPYLYKEEMLDGAKVWRCPLYVPSRPTGFKRILQDVSFFISSVLAVSLLLLRRKRYDLVMVISPSFLSGFVGLWYHFWNRKTRLVYHIQDLQVDAARDLGLLKNKILLKILFAAENYILHKSARVSTISPGMHKKISAKRVHPFKMMLLPNWVDEKKIRPMTPAESLRVEFGLKTSDKVVLYSGNLGEKQGLLAIVDLAKALEHRTDVHFLVCGSGGAKHKLLAAAQASALKNIHFHPLQSEEKLSALLATADIHLVLQKQSAADLVMPSKLSGIWAAGGCALVTASPGTSLYDVIKSNNLGILVEPDSQQALLEALNQALDAKLDGYRKNARAYALKNLAKEHILTHFENELNKLVLER